MGWEIIAELVIGALLLACLIPLVWLFLRRRWLSRQGGIFDCALKSPQGGSRWALGVARYQGEDLEWFRALSLSLRPKVRFRRTSTTVDTQRHAQPGEIEVLYGTPRVVRLESTVLVGGQHSWELAMAPESTTGLLSWLEAAPPGIGRFQQ
ncbi:DUF2550 domain-containing protein [Enemella evansiae]|uniref:DUF2550 domain-containing protein n=1 Tax=Enemella evansiae TaxID=2016499 RepID=UPI000B96B228|nr:DUF2550 domain-containing protein [Enemella evansiae]OYO07467.1 hypothetical protein CGZ98_18615 [Enemella evansiae]OYO12475.1 hypothetical protein BI335_14875 [Enemella evansiae]TDO93389.1 uncharacterized protein DUF2550 [Enemella evansiae]